MADRRLVALQAQASEGVLYVDTAAPAEHIYDVAERRLNALEDLLRVLEVHDVGDVLVHETSRLASAPPHRRSETCASTQRLRLGGPHMAYQKWHTKNSTKKLFFYVIDGCWKMMSSQIVKTYSVGGRFR